MFRCIDTINCYGRYGKYELQETKDVIQLVAPWLWVVMVTTFPEITLHKNEPQ